jgi:hypothetical protein
LILDYAILLNKRATVKSKEKNLQKFCKLRYCKKSKKELKSYRDRKRNKQLNIKMEGLWSRLKAKKNG